MDNSVQSLHRLPILNFDVNKNQKGLLASTGNIGTHKEHVAKMVKERKMGIRNKKKSGIGLELLLNKKKVKAQYQSRRKSSSVKNIKKSVSRCSDYVSQVFQFTATPPPRRIAKKKKEKNVNYQNKHSKALLHTSHKDRCANQVLIDNGCKLKQNYCYNDYQDVKNIILCRPVNHIKQNLEEIEAPKSCHVNKRNCSYSNCLRKSSLYDSCVHYKIIDFSNYDKTDTEVEAINMKRKEFHNCEVQTNTRRKDEAALARSQCSNAQVGGGDGTSINCSTGPNGPRHVRMEKGGNKPEMKNACCHTIKTSRKLILRANEFYWTALKYLFFVIGCLAFLPCIIVLFTCWLLSYCLQRRHSVRNQKCRSSSPIKIHVNGNSKRNENNSTHTWHKSTNIMTYLEKSIKSATYSFVLALKSLLQRDGKLSPIRSTILRKGYSKHGSFSSLKKKRTLYHSKNKGWMMEYGQHRRRNKSNNKCYKNDVRKAKSEPHCIRLTKGNNVDIRTTILSQKHHSHDQLRSYSRHERRMKPPVIRYKVEPCVSYNRSHRIHGCRHICPNVLPVPIKFTNAARKNCRYQNIRIPICHQPLRCNTPTSLRIKNDSPAKQPTIKKKVYQYYKNTKSNMKTIIKDVEAEIWKCDTGCDVLYMRSLRRKPWFFIYRRCPSFYPICLTTSRLCHNFCHCFWLAISACFWCPLLGFYYTVYSIFCDCLQ